MASIKESQVVYIEPNAEESLGTLYKTSDGTNVTKFADPEDFCIVVDLEVEVKGRTFYYSKIGSDNNIKMEATENANGQKIRFMEGSKIYTNKEGTEYITSLTTNYTDCTLNDIQNGGTCEMFGIKSIDISYNSFMVPEVTIQFVDVRGVSLFAQEELRHNLVQESTGMQGITNNDIAGSFFKCFFTFPYPKFTLKVKGFYGDMVSYELTCSDFRAAFESTTGNFNVTAKFIGYAFSFLNDIMSNSVLAAPYSTYLGKDYWDKNNGNRFVVKDKNGTNIAMTPIMEICRNFQKIKEQVNDALSGEGRKEALKEADVSDEDIAKVENADLSGVKSKYQSLTDDAKNKEFYGKKNGECVVTSSTHSFAVFVDKSEDYKTYRDIQEQFKELNTELDKTSGCTQLSNWCKTYDFELIEYDDYTDITNGSDTKISSSKIPDSELQKAIENRSKETIDGKEYNELWTDWDNSHVFVYIDHGLYDILGVTANTSSDNAKEAQEIVQQAGETLINKQAEKLFNFPPTVENITKIIMAHYETYAYMISQCAKIIIGSGTARTPEKLGLSEDLLPDVKAGSTLVPPFPSVTETRTDADGNERTETTWIGKYGNGQQFEEIKLVEGILNGINEVAAAVAGATNDQSYTEDDSSTHIDTPLSYFDLFLGDSDNAFGKVNLSDVDDVFAHAAMHGFTAMALTKGCDAASTLGTHDATNFAKLFANDANIKTLKEALGDSTLNGDAIYAYLSNASQKTRINKSAKSNPWLVSKNLLGEYWGDKSYCVTMVGKIQPNKYGRVFPVKNWTFAQLKEISGGSNYKYIDKHSENFYITPISTEKTKSKLNICDIRYKSCKYFLNSTSNVRGIFIELRKTPYEAISTYKMGKAYNSDGSTSQLGNVIQYNDGGSVKNGGDFALAFGNCFTCEEYYNKSSVLSKAAYFLNKFSCTEYNPQALYNSDKQIAVVMPKFTLLRMGAYLWDYIEVQKNDYSLRNAVTGKIISVFKDWAQNGGFSSIASSYELQFKNGKSYATFIESCNKKDVDKALDENCSNSSAIKSVFNIGNKAGKTINVTPKVCSASKSMVDDLCQIAHLTTLSKLNNKDYDKITTDGPVVKVADMKAYLNSFVNGLRDELKVSTDSQQSNSQSTSSDSTNDSDDIKFGVYSYIKMLYDKWISSDLEIKDYKFESMFIGSDPRFHFIDSYYNKIGKSYYINISTLVKMCVDSQSQNGYSLLSLLSNLYASNKMQFICLQNFANLANTSMMEKMFKPVPYIEMANPSNHPDFIVIYPGETSSKLAISDGEYKDDGLYLNEKELWPVMVKNKQPGGYPIPAFGVSYGQQYQSYFKYIQVDMNTPMATEQSIKAKYMIAGGATGDDKNNGTKIVTIGQDLYTVYSNNSFECTVTMLGCAWVQPMMYFCLLNVPMFRGSYLIKKVVHRIQAGSMETSFTGVRMANTSTRAVRQYLLGQDSDSTNGESNSYEQESAANANVGNDCDYATYSPFAGGGVGTDFSSELSMKLINNLPKNSIDISSMFCKNWTIQQALGAIALQEFGGTSSAAVDQRIAVISCMYNWRGVKKGISAYKTNIFNTCGWGYFQKSNWITRLESVTKNTSQWNQAQQEVYNVFKNGPEKYLLGKTNLLGGTVTSEQIQKGLHTPGTSDGSDMNALIKKWGSVQYKLPPVNGYYHIITGDKGHTEGYVPSKSSSAKEPSQLEQLISGFTQAVQQSLNATETYREAKLKYKLTSKDKSSAWISITGTGNNVMNATYDCIGTAYQSYWEKLFWSVGNGKVNNDAQSVIVKLVVTPPSKHYVGVCDKNGTYIYIDKEEDVNKTLKLALIKYCEKSNPQITNASMAKASILSFSKMDDKTVNKILEFGAEKSSVASCDSVIGEEGGGESGAANGTGFSGLVKNEKMKKVLSDVDHLNSNKLGKNYKLKKNDYHGCCTSGPTTWYGRAGIKCVWWNGGTKPYTFSNTHKNLEGCGFVPVDHGTGNWAESLTTQSLRPGDVMTLYTKTSGHQHACMWTGQDWRSDCIQSSVDCYKHTNYGGRNESFYAVLWRHKDCQESGYTPKHF